jgi:uncharacterized membrane protein YdbT with pleckstrin-like domain
MTYVQKHLMDGETVVYATRLHWIVLTGPVLLALLLGAPGIALLGLSGIHKGGTQPATESMLAGGVVLAAIALIIFVRGILKRNATEMAVTNKRVVAKVGVAARRTVEIILSRVESIGVEETMMGRILGYGTVIVRGTGGTPESFEKIAHPLEFRTQVQQQIDRSQGKV